MQNSVPDVQSFSIKQLKLYHKVLFDNSDKNCVHISVLELC